MKLPLLAIAMLGVCPCMLHAEPLPKGGEPRYEMIEWPMPALPSNRRQTKEEEESGRHYGRELPAAEILQPTLDPTLPNYQRRRDDSLADNLRAAASDTLPGLVRLWIAAFRVYYPKINIDLSPPYDGNFCANELVKGTVDFAFISRVLKPEDVKSFHARFGYDPLSMPISGGTYRHFGFPDALGLFVNKDNPLEKISYDQLDALYSSTRNRGGQAITTWGQLGLTGDWFDKPVHLYGIKPWDSAEDLIRQKVLSYNGRSGKWRDNIQFDSVFTIANHVAEDRLAIGYTGLAYIDSGVRILAVREFDGASFHSPTYENVASASYPLNRGILLNANKPPGAPLKPALEEFVRFILSKEGQQIVLRQAVFLPLRSAQVKNSQSLLVN